MDLEGELGRASLIGHLIERNATMPSSTEVNLPRQDQARLADASKRRAVVIYLRVQGVSVLVWWLVLLVAPGARAAFVPHAASSTFLFAFLPADILIVAVGSLVAAHRWRGDGPPASAWLVAGALWYATAYVAVLWASGEMGPAGPSLMLLASMGMLGVFVVGRS